MGGRIEDKKKLQIYKVICNRLTFKFETDKYDENEKFQSDKLIEQKQKGLSPI